MSILRKFLFPFALIYGIIIRVRNFLFDIRFIKSKSYNIPVICVGNLSVGGTGKTPMIEFLLYLLAPKHNIATLSRGYGRKTKGFILLSGNENATQVGDEPLQFKSKFEDVLVAVDEDRQHGIELLMQKDNAEVILLDDAFQHRKVRAGLNIVLTKYDQLYVDDFMLPTGDLREPVVGVERAHVVVVTKCPKGLSGSQRGAIRDKLRLRNYQKLFFSYIDYDDNIYNVKTTYPISILKNKKITLVTGIANPDPFLKYLEALNLNYEHLNFADHHNFSKVEIDKIAKASCILTTEKDFMRLKDEISHEAFYYLPIKMKIIEDAAGFEKIIENYVN